MPVLPDNHALTDSAVARVDKLSVMEVAPISHPIRITAAVAEMSAPAGSVCMNSKCLNSNTICPSGQTACSDSVPILHLTT